MEGGKRKALILDKFYFTQSKGFCFGLSIFDRTYSFLTLKFEIEILRRFSNLENNFQNHIQVAFSEKQNFGLMKKKRCSNSWFSSTVEWKWKCIFKMKKSKIKNKHYSKIAKRLILTQVQIPSLSCFQDSCILNLRKHLLLLLLLF